MKELIIIIGLIPYWLLQLFPTDLNAPTKTMNSSSISYLALGDSYTIGEAIPGPENFPNQVRSQLRIKGFEMEPPLIIAKTGWTTDELEQGIAMASGQDSLKTSYDFVSLLIGVNDQYRGRNAAAYEPNFTRLLQQAIAYAGNRPDRVIVLSIPDWGITPFAADRNREQIALEIDEFNAVNRKIAKARHVHYIEITSLTREAAHDNSLLAPDGLHPSGKEYLRWAIKIVDYIKEKIKET